MKKLCNDVDAGLDVQFVQSCINAAKRRKGRVMTNADKYFRNATDEEIAQFLKRFSDCAFCPAFSTKCKSINFDNCEDAWLDWLKQEVESDA